ncbi:unnamed protein product [Sphagnum jensenii]|uniref:RING-type E3 ubiquitin transferase n=1 Tax=Sphagnum jensenii TaxID=128206 RepID=A0ABP1APH3_9BRYO
MERNRVTFASGPVDSSTPLLLGNGGSSSSGSGSDGSNNNSRRGGNNNRVQDAARYLRRAGSRRIMREPSMLVRESAAEELEERQSDWAYSRPVVVLDLIWNLAFVQVALAVLTLSKEERPRTPLRVWVLGYALQCILHMLCVCCEYRRRRHQRRTSANPSSSSSTNPSESPPFPASSEHDGGFDDDDAGPLAHKSLAKRLESTNTMFSFVWWIVGFYWITAGGQALPTEAPHLYWLCMVFLAFDVFFVVFCVALACVIGIAVCCCLPCIIAILYAVADQEGASEEDINALAKFKFQHTDSSDQKVSGDKSGALAGVMSLVGSSDSLTDRALSGEDAECCICLLPYDDGVELREIPCRHHFHSACIDKWLRINATCPLCKYNIIHGNTRRREDV